MAKKTCAICGAEIGLIAQQHLADKTCICRKVCKKRCMKLFDFVPATLDQVKAHIEQVEFGTKAWEQIFVPLLKTRNKDDKLKYFGQNGALCVSPSTALIALIQNDYKIFIFGKTTKACVYRLADLYTYEYDSEVTKDSEGKETTKHFCYLGFRNVYGLSEFRLPIRSASEFTDMEKYFNTKFGIQKTLRNSLNNAKRQMNAVKNVTEAIKSAMSGENDIAKGQAAIEAVDASVYGDRTPWIEKADAVLKTVK